MAQETVERYPTEARPVGVILGLSLAAGTLAGLVMAVVVMAVFALFLHHSVIFPVQLMGSLFLGAAHLKDTFDAPAFFLGFFAHQLGPSLLWALVFAVVVRGAKQPLSLNSLLMLGFAIGGIAEIVDVYFLMPAFQKAVNGADLWRAYVPRFWDWAAHFVYGLSLGFFYWVLRESYVGPGDRTLKPRKSKPPLGY